MSLADDISLAASTASTVGVLIAAIQLFQARRQRQTEFENSLTQEYRAIAEKIRVDALLGVELSPEENEKCFDQMFRYSDLTNEQIFLRMHGKVSANTWRFWCDGIASNFNKPAFREAWKRLEYTAPKEFEETRRLLKSKFQDDPRSW